jgi:ParB family chromosome partitioning protein
MANVRPNKFMEQPSNIGAQLERKQHISSYTQQIIEQEEEADERPKSTEGTDAAGIVRYAEPDDISNLFLPYHDERLRLKLLTGEPYEQLKNSIAMDGIFEPVQCVPKEDKLMILAGHNRVQIAKELHIRLPYIVLSGLDEDQMDRICINTNLLNRQLDDYKPSQFAYILKKRNDSEKHQGKKLDPEELPGTQTIKDTYKLSRMSISRYIKLNDLLPQILELVDAGSVNLTTGYQIAFLPQSSQELVLEYLDEIKNDRPITKLRAELAEEHLTEESEILEYTRKRLPELCITTKQKHMTDYRNLKPYIPKQIKPAEVEPFIIKCIQYYLENNDTEGTK